MVNPSDLKYWLWCVLLPSNRASNRSKPHPAKRARLERAFGVRFGELRTDQQFDREQRRQDLFDQRWRRWRSMLVTAGAFVLIAIGTMPVGKAVAALLRVVGAL